MCHRAKSGALTWKALSWWRQGGRRVAHSFMMVASAYTSHFSSQRPPANCSGAMYAGVPFTLVVLRKVLAGSCAHAWFNSSIHRTTPAITTPLPCALLCHAYL